jgi:alkylation response protein AidB-like acyl-CoA dehydrogenase
VPLAIEDDHLVLARVASQFLSDRGGIGPARVALNDSANWPAYWAELANLGWLGLHLEAELGGSGYGLLEAAIIAEQLGRVCAPGPFLPTVAASVAVSKAGTEEQRTALVPSLATGACSVGIATGGSLELDASGHLYAANVVVLGGAGADLVALVLEDDMALVDSKAEGLHVVSPTAVDPGLGLAKVSCEDLLINEDQIIRKGAAPLRHALAVLAAASAAGGAAACREMATDYAKNREAFGHRIGQFQAVKHNCATMLVDEEVAGAAAWNAARLDPDGRAAPFGQAALGLALQAFLSNAKRNIQVHGGIGFTWEHDGHLFLRRAMSLSAFFGPVGEVFARTAELGLDATASRVPLKLPQEAEQVRASVRSFVARYWQLPENERHAYAIEEGYLFPHWPRPWGRSAGPIEQLVIEEELIGVPRMKPLGSTAWTLPINVPTILAHGTADQQERWIQSTMEGRLKWCQLMSEPGAGSDLAALSTRAERTDGGWLLTGQKVWTSDAHNADVGFALVRTDRETVKHAGITCMVVDMRSPGVTVRPLRQITGHAHFNEVFLDEVFVSDDDVVGHVNDGWNVTRTSLGNERVSLGEGSPWAPQRTLELIQAQANASAAEDPSLLRETGMLVAKATAISALNARQAARSLGAGDRLTDGNLTKLVVAEFSQAVCELGIRLGGTEALFTEGAPGALATGFLHSRAATIAGGTSEIMRNIIGERVLGLPRDDAP